MWLSLLACQDVGLVTQQTPDEDGDGYDETEDCDDLDPDAWPGAPEIADDGVDQDCDGLDAFTVYGFPDDLETQRIDPGFLMGSRVEVSYPLVVTHLGVRVSEPDGELRLGLYSGQAGRPDALLAQTFDEAAVDGVNELSVSDAATLEPGTYWVHIRTSSLTQVGKGDVAPITYRGVPWDHGLPDPFGQATAYEDARFSAWVVGELP